MGVVGEEVVELGDQLLGCWRWGKRGVVSFGKGFGGSWSSTCLPEIPDCILAVYTTCVWKSDGKQRPYEFKMGSG